MERHEFWISNGSLVSKPEPEDGKPLSERILLHQKNLVKVTVSEYGTAFKWHCFSANWASLFFAKQWIETFRGPYIFTYYMSGWFTETIVDITNAQDRIDQLIAKSDLHLSSRIYTQTFDPKAHELPETIRKTLETGVAPVESSIDCLLDRETGQARVTRIGSSSAIAKLWGLSPVTTPCISGTNYDKEVNKGYYDALSTGRPHYDHIYAAMMGSDGEVAWIPYQRIVVPHSKPKGRWRKVTVVSEVTPVAISVV